MAKTLHKPFSTLIAGGLTGTALLLAGLAPVAVRAQSTLAATRAINAAPADPPVPLPSLSYGPGTDFAAAPAGSIDPETGSSPALLNTASLLSAVEAAGLTPFTGPPPPVECIPSLNENSFSAFPPQASC